MPRRIGALPLLGLDADIRIEGTWDTRQYVPTFADLLAFTEADKIPNRFFVTVGNDPNEILNGQYECLNKAAMHLPESWKKVGQIEVIYTYITYTAWRALMAANNLIVGSWYAITDHQTINIVTNSPSNMHLNVQGTIYTDKTTWTNDLSEGVEVIAVQAVTTSTVAAEAFSPAFPNDIIVYDGLNDVCEDGVTPRKGKITERRLPSQRINTPFDFRNVKHIRYGIEAPLYAAGTTYAKDTVVEYNNALYVCLLDNTVGVTPSNAATNLNWALLLNFGADAWGRRTISRYLGIAGPTTNIGGKQVPVNTAAFRHYHTFNTLADPDLELCNPVISPSIVYNVNIGANPNNPYSNIIFSTPWIAANTYQDIRNFDIGFQTSNSSFVCGGIAFSMKQSCSSVIVKSPCYGFYLGEGNSGWVIDAANGFHPTDLSSSALVRNVVFHRGVKSHFEHDILNIISKGEISGSTIGSGSSGIVFHDYFSNSRILMRLINCTFKGGVSASLFNHQLTGYTFEGAITNVTWSDMKGNALTPFTATNTFDRTKIMKLGGTGDTFNANHVLDNAATGNVMDTFLTVLVTGNGTNTITFGTGWKNANAGTFNPANGVKNEIIMRYVDANNKTYTITQPA